MIFALVLAGGKSSRFGREKAMEPLAGEPMIAWTLQALSNGATRLAINAPAASAAWGLAEAQDLPCLPDAEGAPAGPLAGVRAGLEWAAQGGANWLATAPCDTPLIPADLVVRLLAGAGPGGGVVRTSQGLQPLCALWPVGLRAQIGLLEGHPPIRQVLATLGAVEVLFGDEHAFANINTKEDHKAALARVAKRHP